MVYYLFIVKDVNVSFSHYKLWHFVAIKLSYTEEQNDDIP